ncbi:MAG: hypothetical protein M1840_002952 [Geoglossum simile]|nr:MAG: hypothetical protein M1840_002952 [Geoglossum simile]
MASDEVFTSFLDKANEISSASGSVSHEAAATTKTVDANVLTRPRSIGKYYISESDEPFVPLNLKWSGEGFPSEDEFQALLLNDSKAKVSVTNPDEWDPRGDYISVIEAVRAAARTEDVKVYRIQHDHSRAEYYVVGLDRESAGIVGMKAKAVES